MWYPSSGGQSQSDTSQLTASVIEEIGCMALRFIMIAEISVGFGAKMSCSEACRLVAIPAPQNRVCMQTRNSCTVANPEQSPLLCVTPPAALRRCVQSRVPRSVPAGFQFHFPTAWLDRPKSSQVSSTPSGRPKNISHVPIKHVF